MAFPLFPSLMPGAMDSLWFSVDIPIDEDHELQELELQQKTLVSFLSLPTALLLPCTDNLQNFTFGTWLDVKVFHKLQIFKTSTSLDSR